MENSNILPKIYEFRDIYTSNNLKKIKKLFQKTGINIFNDFISEMYIWSSIYDIIDIIEYIYKFKYFKLIKYLHVINSNFFAKNDNGLKYSLKHGHLHITKWVLSNNIYDTEKSKKIFYDYSIYYNHLHLIKYLLKLYPNICIFANRNFMFPKIMSFDKKKYIEKFYFILQYKNQHLQIKSQYLQLTYKKRLICYYSKDKQIIKWMF